MTQNSEHYLLYIIPAVNCCRQHYTLVEYSLSPMNGESCFGGFGVSRHINFFVRPLHQYSSAR